jgi:hypothetical protein
MSLTANIRVSGEKQKAKSLTVVLYHEIAVQIGTPGTPFIHLLSQLAYEKFENYTVWNSFWTTFDRIRWFLGTGWGWESCWVTQKMFRQRRRGWQRFGLKRNFRNEGRIVQSY